MGFRDIISDFPAEVLANISNWNFIYDLFTNLQVLQIIEKNIVINIKYSHPAVLLHIES